MNKYAILTSFTYGMNWSEFENDIPITYFTEIEALHSLNDHLLELKVEVDNGNLEDYDPFDYEIVEIVEDSNSIICEKYKLLFHKVILFNI